MGPLTLAAGGALTLRFGALLAKYLLLMTMATCGQVVGLAVFGLLQGTAALYSKIAGLGFGLSALRWGPLLSHATFRRFLETSIAVWICAHAATTLVAAAAWCSLAAPAWVLWLAVVICISDHLAHEFAQAAVLRENMFQFILWNFVCTGGWCLGAAFVGFLFISGSWLGAILGFWTAGALLATLMGLKHFRPRMAAVARSFSRRRMRWATLHFRRSVPIYAAALALVMSIYADRFVLGALSDLATLAAFTFVLSIGFALESLLVGAMAQLRVASLIRSFRDGRSTYFREVIIAAANVLCLAAPSGASAVALVLFLGDSLAPDVIGSDLAVLVIIAAYVLRCVGSVFYYGCYAAGWFWLPAVAVGLSVCVSAGAMLVLVAPHGLDGADAAVLLASLSYVTTYGWGLWLLCQRR